MRSGQIFSTFFVGAFFFLALCPSQAEQGGVAKAKQLFDEAMAADAAGDGETREYLLNAAVQADPDFELARWHLGQVKFRSYWRSLDTVQSIVQHDPRWKEYYELLQHTDDTTVGQKQLALWCRRNSLVHEERIHWQRVLQLAPDHEKALNALGKKPYQGQYLTGEEITQQKQQARQAQLSFKRYQKEFKKLIEEARNGDQTARSEKLDELAQVDDPAAVDALFAVVTKACPEENADAEAESDSFARQLCKAAIAALEGIPYHPATLRLLDVAVFAPQGDIRLRAAEALRYREPTDYMPLLMDCMKAPLEFSFSVNVLPDGQVQVLEDIYVEGLEEGQRQVRDVGYAALRRERIRSRDGSEEMTVLVPDAQAGLRTASNRIARTQSKVAKENFSRAIRNARICEVLRAVTDQDLGNDPHAWWDAWVEYNELYTPETVPVQSSFTQEYVPYIPMSCFLAGTPVWTQAGPVPIETIKPGDLVLSQDPITGRLDFRPVLDTTLRPPSEMLNLSINGETITTTLGHRFWLAGEGWRMAKFLNNGNPLFTLLGSTEIESIEPTEEAEAHNLVVDGYHTYFVGKSRLLVHDNSCPVPCVVVLPGVEPTGSHLR